MLIFICDDKHHIYKIENMVLHLYEIICVRIAKHQSAHQHPHHHPHQCYSYQNINHNAIDGQFDYQTIYYYCRNAWSTLFMLQVFMFAHKVVSQWQWPQIKCSYRQHTHTLFICGHVSVYMYCECISVSNSILYMAVLSESKKESPTIYRFI